MKFFYGTFGVEMRAYGQKLVKFCTHTHRHTDIRVNLSSIDYTASVAEWLRTWDTLTMFEATVCGRS